MSEPLVSVIIPTYNRSTLLKRAAMSVLEQTCQDFELIIVDDASTDDTGQVVAALASPKIRYFRQDKNRGAQAARNLGLKSARGQYVAFLDSDDVWYPQKLELQCEAFRGASEKVGVVYCHADVINEAKNSRAELIYRHKGNMYQKLLSYPDIDFITPLVKRECFERIGLLDENVPAFQEWDTFIRLSKYYEFELVPRKLAAYHFHRKGSISGGFRRDVKGYHYIINKYKSEIIKICGYGTMVRHYIRLSLRLAVWLKMMVYQKIKSEQ